MNCDETAPEDWVQRFAGRCYFYPRRDCPGWQPGRMCSRIESRIPQDALDVETERASDLRSDG